MLAATRRVQPSQPRTVVSLSAFSGFQRRRLATATFSEVSTPKSEDRTAPEVFDPDMNGGYINPPAIKRQHRDPYADWWDKTEMRNFGEPIHEDNDVLGVFSPHEYTHFTPAKGFFMCGCFVALILGLTFTVRLNQPDIPAMPREFQDGLEKELGGPRALRARKAGDQDP